jgi:hypothetical protein
MTLKGRDSTALTPSKRIRRNTWVVFRKTRLKNVSNNGRTAGISIRV